MVNLAKSGAIIAACLLATTTASAIDMMQPFVSVTVSHEPLYLGEVYGPGVKELTAQSVARVVANCPYHIEASFQGLRHEQGGPAISPRHMTVAINGRRVPVGRERVPIATGRQATSSRGVDVPIELQVGVSGLATYPAGRYAGTLVITVTAGP
jgi:hypothetical protein